MLDREEASGAAEPTLNLVGDEQRAVTAANLCGAFQVAVGRHVDALALDRLNDEGRNVVAMQGALERRQIVEGHGRKFRQERLESRAVDAIAVERQRSVRQPVKGVLA